MKNLTSDDLRALIRLIPPMRALQDELEKSIPLETYEGTGNLAVRSFQGLQQSVYTITEEPYVAALGINLDEGATERQLIAQVSLAVGQLIAYVEGQTGVAGLTLRPAPHIQTAPTITLNMDSFQGSPEETDRIMRTLDRAIRFQPPVPPAPPVPPSPPGFPPAPPRPPRAPFGRRPYDEDDEV
ncbi:MAG TPA: hypothetical protein VHD90_12880 [Phototrophicaceae bacterium]|nr:hypothetical protein [Phototrophicaceae bacterium]